MGIKKKFGITFFVLIFFILLFNKSTYAGTQKWNSLDYDVTLNLDGSMNVVETWNIKISNTNTLFKDFDMTSGITDVGVSLIEDGTEKKLEEIYEEQYHVDPGCFYGLLTQKSQFEIAWNVGLDNSSDTKTYKIYYKVVNAVNVYNDCTEFYWMFLSRDNQIPGKNVTGTIHLPGKVTDIEKLRVWAHGELSGNIERTSEDTIKFSIDTLNPQTMLEVRVVTEENIYEDSKNFYNRYKLDEILKEEQAWADKANKEREDAKNQVFEMIIVNIFIGLFFILKFKKYVKYGKKLEEEYSLPEYEIDYFRDIPDEKNATPARASYITSFQTGQSKIFSATLLEFSLKGILEFRVIEKDNIEIIIKDKNAEYALTEDENYVYEILLDAVKYADKITVKEFENYAKIYYEDIYSKMNSIQRCVEKYEEESGKIDKEKKKVSRKVIIKFSIYLILFCIALIGQMHLILVVPTLFVGLLACMIVCGKNCSKISIFSEKGNIEVKQWNALKKYMEDYSLLKEKNVPDIVLWEKYLVYATVFGISKKVIEQLKVIHPEMFEINDQTNSMNSYGYWNIVCNDRFGTNGFDNLSKGLEKVYTKASSAYSAAHSSDSSGSGSGGGFSSGGGGRRRWRRLRRTLIQKRGKNNMNDVEILFIINILIGLCFFLIIKNYVKMGKELNKTYDFEDKDYRDIPNELNATPARALFIMDNDLSLENEKIFSATMFDLCLKDVIQFEVVDSRNVNISIKNKYNILLPEDEKIIYDILLKAMGDRNSISLKEFQSYYEVRSREFFQTLRSVEGAAKEYQRECGNIDLEKEKK